MPSPESTTALVSNSAFLRELAGGAPNGSSLWVTSFTGSPDLTDSKNWFGKPYNAATMTAQVDGWGDQNAYFSVAALHPTADGEVRRRKANFARLLALVVDDVQMEDVQGQVSYVLATSPGKFQVGVFIDRSDADAANAGLVDRLVTSMVERGMLRADMSGNNAVRYVRLPVGQNQKPRESGVWQHRMLRWTPTARLSLADAAAAFGIDLDQLRAESTAAAPGASASIGMQDERLRVLTANVIRGENLHDSINQIAASLVSVGTPGGAVVNTLRGLMDASLAPKDERWLARYQDIARAVTTAQEKYGRPIIEIDLSPIGGGSGVQLLNLRELDAASRAVRWCVKHVLPGDSIGLMFGAPGTFKSFVALDMALHIAHGLKWLGKKTTKGPVIYIAAEGGTGLMRRIHAWHKARKLEWAEIDFYVIPSAVMLSSRCAEVVEAAKALGVEPVLVIVDTKSQTDEGEENSANDTAAYFRGLGSSFRALWGCAVLVIHHSGLNATERPRGSSAIVGNIDFMFGVFRDEKEMLATVANLRQKEGELFDDQTFALSVESLGHDEDGDPITSLVASHINNAEALLEAVQRESRAGRGGNNQLFLSLAVNGIEEKKLRTLFMDELGSKDPEAKRKAYYRAREWAIRSGFLEIAQGVVIVLQPVDN